MLGKIQTTALIVLIDAIVLIISIILIKKYLKKKMMYPKTRLIRGAGVTNDDLDINNIFTHDRWYNCI